MVLMLVIALSGHVLLLAWQARETPLKLSKTKAETITVRLQTTPRPAAVSSMEPDATPAPPEQPAPAPEPVRPAVLVETSRPLISRVTAPSSEQIRRQVLDWFDTERNQPALVNSALLPALPANWTEPVLLNTQTAFATAWLPPKVLVLDRWNNPDGSNRVHFRGPDGGLYCGRQEAFDPLEPLLEPVMLVRRC